MKENQRVELALILRATEAESPSRLRPFALRYSRAMTPPRCERCSSCRSSGFATWS